MGGPAEEVNSKVAEAAQKQDVQLESAQTPQESAALSIDFAKDSVKAVESSLRSDDFSTTSYVMQRLEDHIDRALENSKKSGSVTLAAKLKTFCLQADMLFRTQQLIVPEGAEQDVAIVRAKCFNITQ